MDQTAIEDLVQRLVGYNASYRAGHSAISDREYDDLVEQLRSVAPEHPFLHTVEPEVLKTESTVRHKVRMLSTEKAYTTDALQRFVDKVEKAARELGRTTQFRVTPKLDGMAGKDEDESWHLEEMASSATTLRISSSAECVPSAVVGLDPARS